MSSRKRKRAGKGQRPAQLTRLKKSGSQLLSPLSDLPVRSLDWSRDLLPEHLWLAALADQFGIDDFHRPVYALLDAVDDCWLPEAKSPCLGLVTDFARIPKTAREAFLDRHRSLAQELVWVPIGEALSLYPDCPAAWLVDILREPGHGSIDTFRALGQLRRLTGELLNERGEFAMRLRMIPFARQLKHGRMFFTEDITLTTLLPKYFTNLTKSERLQVESMVRAASATFLPNVEHLKGCDWPKYFWRHNYDLTVCQPVERRPPPGFVRADTADIETLSSKLESAASSVSKYMGRLASRIQIDLYDPRRDEVLLGLFARVSRLFILMMDDPRIWARDVGSIILRCLAETAITFVYLVKKGKVDEFEKFVSYGEGQRKLLMLHLQDNYPTATSHDGMTAEEAEKSLDVFPGLIDIELGHWAGQDVRRLAQKAGMERLYRLVFSPASGEVHGNWLALKDTSLTYCAEPLHRIHRLPALAEPPFYVTIAETARTLWEHCHEVAVEDLRYPDVEPIPRFK